MGVQGVGRVMCEGKSDLSYENCWKLRFENY